MYLILTPTNSLSIGYFSVMCTDDPLKVNEYLNNKDCELHIYKLDKLQKVTGMQVTCKEKLA